MLEVRLFGKFDINYDGEPITISSRIAQSLFAYLILTAGTLHRREKLAGTFWPDATEEKARAYLRHEFWRIRKALSTKSKGDYLLADDINISFNSSAEYSLDVATFTKVGETASVDDLKRALAVFEEELLPGFYDEWINPEREHLQALYEQKMTRLLEQLKDAKCWPDILEWVERWTSFGRASEAAYRYLIIAYDALGDKAMVASTYKRCLQALSALDLEPSEQTRVLAFKRNPKINISIPLTSFIGREKELKEVAGLFSKSRLITLTGSGGVGKTRLAIQAVAEVLDLFPDGVWFLDLAPLTNPSLVPNTLASLLGLRESGEISTTDLLINYFRSRKALVIFDNCEHLIKICAQLVHSLLTSSEHLSILATSREALRVSGEFPYRVPSLEFLSLDVISTIDQLSTIESVRLFVERAAVALPGFTIDVQNGFTIAQICRRLDGIPLAIELAAARTNMLSCQQILTRLDDRFNFLTGGLHSDLPRHQTLRAMIQWSYDLLPAQEQLLFNRLSVFAGGWSLEAAEQVCVGNNDVETFQILDLLTQLLNKSLIVVERTQGLKPRYHMLETIRQYAEEKALASSEREIIRHSHLTYFVEMAEQADENLHSSDMIMWLDRLETELDNMRAALAWGLESNIEFMLRLAGALPKFWHTRGFTLEGIKWLDQGLSAEKATEGNQPLMLNRSIIRGKALIANLTLLTRLPDFEKATTCYNESLALFQALGPEGKPGMAWALLLGAASNLTDQEVPSLEQSLALFYETGDKIGISECLIQLADYAEFEEDYGKATALVEAHLSLRREIGDQDGIGAALLKLGVFAFFWKDDYEQAVTFFEESLCCFRSITKKSGVSWVLANYGEVCLWYGDYARAARNFEEGRRLAQDVGEKFLYAQNSYGLGVTNWFHGDYAGAIQMIKTSMPIFNELWHCRGVPWIFHVLGDIALARADEQTAAQLYEDEMTLSEEQQDHMNISIALCGLGKLAWAKGDYDLATKRCQESLMVLPETAPNLAKFNALFGLGRVAQSRGDSSGARAYYDEVLRICRQRTTHPFHCTSIKTFNAVVAYPLDALAILATVQHQMDYSACLFGAVEAIYPALCYERPAVERAEHDKSVAVVRAALGEKAFAAAWERGQKMTVDEAIAYSFEELP
jgi:predicted ATPase/tetratricopeptide (TPR) repeat protein